MRDKFPANAVETLAKRAGNRCSYCGLATSGPHDDPSKWVNVGEAAHIMAASEDGPRYDPTQSPEERISAVNGIWLCSKHHTLIDRDVARFPVDVLHRLKEEAEDRIRKEIDGGGSAPEFKRIFSVPYPRNIFFTGREEILQGLAAQLQVGGKAALGQAAPSDLPPSSRAAISGLGGIGKTQTVVEFAYRHRDEYRAVFFVRAATAGELLSGFANIASQLGIAGHEQDQNATAQAARQWLETQENWLLILDNADEPALLEPYLPADGQGHILITSRAQDFAALSIDGQRLAPPPNEEALAFLLRRTRRQTAGEDEKEAAAELANELGNLPLALEQAAAYLSTRRVSFSDYLASYFRRGLELVGQIGPQAGTRHNPIAITWSLNLEQVQRESPASADLLHAAAFLSPDAIPDEFFLDGGNEISARLGAALASRDPLAVAELAAPLLRYSLVERDAEKRTLSLHPLVQEVVKKNLGDVENETLQRVVKALHFTFPLPEFKTWLRCERLLPHLLSIANLAEDGDELSSLLQAGAVYLWSRDRFTEAEPLFERSLAIREMSLDGNHPAVAQSLNRLAVLYASQGRFAEAQPLFERSLAIREKSLGGEHSEIATSLNNLASLYTGQGRSAEAEPLYERSLAIWERSLGGDHPHVATSLNNLANLYTHHGRWAQAEPLYKRSLAIRKKSLGDDHPDVASSLSSLAFHYAKKGRVAEAASLYERSLAIQEKSLGGDHPDVATSLNNLANLYADQNRFAEAEPLYGRSLAIQEKSVGGEHPKVATSLNNLAILYWVQDRFAEAEPLFERSLAIREKSLRGDHPEIAQSLSNLAILRRKQGREAEAKELEARAREVGARHEARNRRT